MYIFKILIIFHTEDSLGGVMLSHCFLCIVSATEFSWKILNLSVIEFQHFYRFCKQSWNLEAYILSSFFHSNWNNLANLYQVAWCEWALSTCSLKAGLLCWIVLISTAFPDPFFHFYLLHFVPWNPSLRNCLT